MGAEITPERWILNGRGQIGNRLLYNSLELALEMETSKFTVAAMSFQCFSNILNQCGELIEQVPGDCPTPSEKSVGCFIQNIHLEHTFGRLLASCTCMLCVCVCCVCIQMYIY